MNLDEAKIFYKKYLGAQFHMGREEWPKYQAFQALCINDDLLTAWDQELFEEQLALLWEDPNGIWLHHENVLQILLRGRCSGSHCGGLLLGEMEKMTSLDDANLILIVENMAGRDINQKQGGVYFFCTKTSLSAKLEICMERIFDSASENAINDDRYKTAIERYQAAMQLYGRLNFRR